MPAPWFLLILLLAPLEADTEEIRQCTYPDGTVEWRDRDCPPGRGIGSEKHESGDGRGTFTTIPADRPPATRLERAERSRRRTGGRSRTSRAESDASKRAVALRCAEYEKRIDAIDRRLRKGYTVSEGNELRAERRRIQRALSRGCR
jgi:hypothetical protein